MSVPTPLRAVGAALVLVILLAAPGAARANDPERAKALFGEAKALHDAGDDRAALEKLKAAYDAFPAAGIMVSIANRHLDLGEPEEARDVLAGLSAPKGALKRKVKELDDRVRAMLAQPISVEIVADVDDARVSIDGAPSRKLPLQVMLSRGDHQLIVEAPGRERAVIDRLLKGTNPLTIKADLPVPQGRWRLALLPAGPLGDVRLVFDGAQVNLDATERQGVVTEERTTRPGQYKVQCLRGMDELATTTIVVRSNEVSTAVCTFRAAVDEGGGPDVLGWASAGGAVLTFALGTYFLASYLDDVETYPEPRYEISSTKPLGAGLMYTSAVGLGVLSVLSFTDSI